MHLLQSRQFATRAAALLLLTCTIVPAALAQTTPPPADDPLTDYRTVATAVTCQIAETEPQAAGQPGYLGVCIEPDKRGRLIVAGVAPGSPAETAGVQVGDEIQTVDGKRVRTPADLMADTRGKAPASELKIVVRRKGRAATLTATLGTASHPMELTDSATSQRAATDDPEPQAARIAATPARTTFTKPVFRLAVVCVEFPDVKHSAQIGPEAWSEALFSTGVYKDKKNSTGQDVFGSVNDYYQEQSCGALKMEGKVFDWVTTSKNRIDYNTGSKAVFLNEALNLVTARDGKDALEGFDGVLFVYAGPRVATNRGALFWPHRSAVSFRTKRLSYFICPEGGTKMTNISVFCHEFGHMLGLPDLYARPENPGSEGVGVWCAMSQQLGNGRPQHFSAWCKTRMGWLKPAVIDPTVKQKLILSPIEGATTECYKVLIRRDGSEYLLLENRRKQAFDQNLPAEGLLIWHVVGTRPILEESHGVEGPAGPRAHLKAVPYPTEANNSYTPYTIPSSRSQLGGGLPVFITNIRSLPDGRVTFWVGYEFS